MDTTHDQDDRRGQPAPGDAHTDAEPISWRLGQPGCGAYVFTAYRGQPQPCERAVAWAGLVLVESRRPVELWVKFACERHVGHLHAPRRLLDRDHARLDQRRAYHTQALAGRGRDRPGALAIGRDARHRLRRALDLATTDVPH